jgi:hypothetical protein
LSHGVGLRDRHEELGHGLDLHVAVHQLPLDGMDRPRDRRPWQVGRS